MKKEQNILKLDFGSTTTKIDLNGSQSIINTLVPVDYNWKDEYNQLDIMFEHLKKEWVIDSNKRIAVIKFFKYIHKDILKNTNLTVVYATYPTHFNIKDKKRYAKIIKEAFNVNKVYLTSEANALVHGAKAAYLENATIMDIGGFTTDICFYKNNEADIETKGIKCGGEDISDMIAKELYKNDFLPYYDLYTAKKIKELRFSNVKKYLELITDILVNNQTRETKVTFSELNTFIDSLFKTHYENLLKSIDIDGYSDTVIITGAISNVGAFQEIASNILNNPVFEGNPFTLLEGLTKMDYKDVLEEDLYIQGKYDGITHYQLLARKGTVLPCKTNFNCWITGCDINIVTLSVNSSFYKSEKEISCFNVHNVKQWGIISPKYTISDRINNFDIEVHSDKVNLIVNERVSAFGIEYTKEDIELIKNAEELAEQEFLKAKRLRQAKLLHSYDILLQRIDSFQCNDETKDIISTVIMDLKKVSEEPSEKHSFTYPMVSIKEEQINQIKTYDDFCSIVKLGDVTQYSYQPLMNFVNKTIYKEEIKFFFFKKKVLDSSKFTKMKSICTYYALLCNNATDDLIRKTQINTDKETIKVVNNLLATAELNEKVKS